jgi:hypothetical protein
MSAPPVNQCPQCNSNVSWKTSASGNSYQKCSKRGCGWWTGSNKAAAQSQNNNNTFQGNYGFKTPTQYSGQPQAAPPGFNFVPPGYPNNISSTPTFPPFPDESHDSEPQAPVQPIPKRLREEHPVVSDGEATALSFLKAYLEMNAEYQRTLSVALHELKESTINALQHVADQLQEIKQSKPQ